MSARLRTVLLPGMDGTGRLFRPYIDVDPDARPLSYPGDVALGYDELEVYVRERLPREPFLIVAESFSGPLAVRIGAEPPPELRGIVLVATFVRNPSPLPAFTPIPALLFRSPPPQLALRVMLAGNAELAEAVQIAIRSVSPLVMAHRLRCVLQVDARDALQRCAIPILAMRATRDRLVFRRSTDEMRALAPRMQLVELSTPHLLLQSAPHAAFDAITWFSAVL